MREIYLIDKLETGEDKIYRTETFSLGRNILYMYPITSHFGKQYSRSTSREQIQMAIVKNVRRADRGIIKPIVDENPKKYRINENFF